MTRRTPLRRQPAVAAVSAKAPPALSFEKAFFGAMEGAVRDARSRRNIGQFQSEHVLQIAVAQYLDRALPPDAFWTSIDSAGRGPIAGARMKRRGVKRGLPDILILWSSVTLWIELKSRKGRVSEQQDDFGWHAIRAGHHWHVCRSVDDLASRLAEYGIPLRARIAA